VPLPSIPACGYRACPEPVLLGGHLLPIADLGLIVAGGLPKAEAFVQSSRIDRATMA